MRLVRTKGLEVFPVVSGYSPRPPSLECWYDEVILENGNGNIAKSKRGARFPKGRRALLICTLLTRLLLEPFKLTFLSFPMEVDGGLLRLGMDAWLCCGGRRRRWRDAVFEGPFGRSPGLSKFVEPRRRQSHAVHPALKQRVHHPSPAPDSLQIF